MQCNEKSIVNVYGLFLLNNEWNNINIKWNQMKNCLEVIKQFVNVNLKKFK